MCLIYTCANQIFDIYYKNLALKNKTNQEEKIICIIWSYLLSHEVQPALQGVGHFDLPIAVVDLHTSRADIKKQKLGSKAGAV